MTIAADATGRKRANSHGGLTEFARGKRIVITMPLSLSWNASTALPIDADCLRPEQLAGLPPTEVARLPVHAGNRTVELGELFRIAGDGGDQHVLLEGDLRRVHGIGRRMSAGRLSIRGDVGHRLGTEMSGGSIHLQGSAGDWTGAEMRGGLLHIRGSAGHQLGAAYPGARLGMRDGTIVVEGSAGDDVGLAMRRGLIAVSGAVGMGPGRAMIAGSIFAFGPVGRRAGAGMKRGTLALFGDEPVDVLPTFRLANRYRPPFVTLYLRALQDLGFPIPHTAYEGMFERYNGDLLETGKGEILRKVT